MSSLTTRVINSLGWVFTNMAAKTVLQFARPIILWRLLDADEFGLNGMAWLAINAFTLLQDMGFQSALIQRRDDIEKAVTVTWYANVLIRVLVYSVLFLAAPLVAANYDEPEVCPILRVAGICVVLGSFGSANEALLRKHFQFGRILAVETVEFGVLLVAQVALAWAGFGVWSLVYGTMISAVSRSLTLWWLAPIRLVKLDFRVAREMFHFGKHMTVSTLLLWLIGNIDYYFVGTFMGKAALGFYTLAFNNAFYLVRNVSRLLGSVLFPAFSEIGRDVDRMRGAWLRAVRYTMILMMPMGLGMIVFSRELVRAFYLPICDITVLPMAILTVASLCRALGVPMGDLQKGIGRPDLLTWVAFWHLVVLAPLLAMLVLPLNPACRAVLGIADLRPAEVSVALYFLDPAVMGIGLCGVSAAIASTTLAVGVGVALLLTSREIRFTRAQLMEALRPALVGGVSMVAAAWIAKAGIAALFDLPPLVVLLTLGPFSLAAYFLALRVGFPECVRDVRGLLDRRREDRRKRQQMAARAVVGEE